MTVTYTTDQRKIDGWSFFFLVTTWKLFGITVWERVERLHT